MGHTGGNERPKEKVLMLVLFRDGSFPHLTSYCQLRLILLQLVGFRVMQDTQAKFTAALGAKM